MPCFFYRSLSDDRFLPIEIKHSIVLAGLAETCGEDHFFALHILLKTARVQGGKNGERRVCDRSIGFAPVPFSLIRRGDPMPEFRRPVRAEILDDGFAHRFPRGKRDLIGKANAPPLVREQNALEIFGRRRFAAEVVFIIVPPKTVAFVIRRMGGIKGHIRA